MTLYSFVLFLHVTAVLVIVGMAAMVHTSEFMMRRASTVAELRRLSRPGDAGPLFGLMVLVLLGLGAWLVNLSKAPDHFKFSTPFVAVAEPTAVFMFFAGLGVLGRHQSRLKKRLAAEPDGPVPDELRRLALSPTPLTVSGLLLGLLLATVFNMATKPSVGGCLAALAVGGVIGAAANRQMSRLPAGDEVSLNPQPIPPGLGDPVAE